MFQQVKTKKVYEEIVAQIKKLMVDGKLQPGDKLSSERDLAEQLGVSRASVREALSALEMAGIIEIRSGEGSFVKQVSFSGLLEPLSFCLLVESQEVDHFLEVRRVLEAEAAALAAMRAGEAEKEEIRQALEAMRLEIMAGGFGDEGDTAFHVAVAKAAKNPILNQIMGVITELMSKTFRSARQKMFLASGVADSIYASHVAVYRAIVERNPQQARMCMQKHLFLLEEASQYTSGQSAQPGGKA